MEWKIVYYNEGLQNKILSLPPGMQARYVHLTRRMQVHGANLGMPHTQAMKDGLFELRLKSKEGIGRVFYCTLSGQQIVMLSSFIKKTQKTPPNELTKAKARMKEVKSNANT